jgi:tetratricopeptide (TPR) repeat protein
MRARLGLAEALWARGLREEAVDHLTDMLRLNPNDNQGLRDGLANYLAQMGRDEELAALLERYREDGGAVLTWSRALLAFRRGGDCEQSRRALTEATAANGFVAALLTGAETLPKTAPAFYSLGGKDEAVMYCQRFAEAWPLTPGAIEWVRRPDEAPPMRGRRAQ